MIHSLPRNLQNVCLHIIREPIQPQVPFSTWYLLQKKEKKHRRNSSTVNPLLPAIIQIIRRTASVYNVPYSDFGVHGGARYSAPY